MRNVRQKLFISKFFKNHSSFISAEINSHNCFHYKTQNYSTLTANLLTNN